MTLTGGLWLGVSNVKDSPLFQMVLLGLAMLGNLALIVVLARLRFVMGGYLEWIKNNESGAAINSEGKQFWEKNHVVRSTFQSVLFLAALVSLGLLINTGLKWRADSGTFERTEEAYYDGYASRLADEFEVPDFKLAHPYLAANLPAVPKLSILDVGSGGKRDSAAMIALGHEVTLAEPSESLVRFRIPSGPALPKGKTIYLSDQRIDGSANTHKFDIVVVNGVWAHIPIDRRQRAMDRLLDMVRPGGRLYMAFRDGPADLSRSVYAAPVNEIRRLARGSGVSVQELPSQPDLIGRPDVLWRSVVIRIADPPLSDHQ